MACELDEGNVPCHMGDASEQGASAEASLSPELSNAQQLTVPAEFAVAAAETRPRKQHQAG